MDETTAFLLALALCVVVFTPIGFSIGYAQAQRDCVTYPKHFVMQARHDQSMTIQIEPN